MVYRFGTGLQTICFFRFFPNQSRGKHLPLLVGKHYKKRESIRCGFMGGTSAGILFFLFQDQTQRFNDFNPTTRVKGKHFALTLQVTRVST